VQPADQAHRPGESDLQLLEERIVSRQLGVGIDGAAGKLAQVDM